jgi:glycosyltransferase involved in cell wall biosynthesis
MRIAVFGQIRADETGLYTDRLNAAFLKALRVHFDEVTLAAIVVPRNGAEFNSDTAICAPIRVINLGEKIGVAGMMSPTHVGSIARAIREADCLYVPSGHLALKVWALNGLTFHRRLLVYERGYWLDAPSIRERFSRPTGIAARSYFRVAQLCRREMLRSAHKVFVHGVALQRECEALAPREQIEAVVPLIDFGPDDCFRRTDTCASEPATVLFVGGVGAKKGVEYLLLAASELCRGCSLRVRVITKVPLLPAQWEQIRLLRLDDIIESIVAPTRGELIQHYRTADVLVVPSISEGVPRVLYEGMSQGLPVVATDVGGIPGLISHDDNGLLVPPREPAALAGAVRRLLEDRPLRRRLIDGGYRTVDPILRAADCGGGHAIQVFRACRS